MFRVGVGLRLVASRTKRGQKRSQNHNQRLGMSKNCDDQDAWQQYHLDQQKQNINTMTVNGQSIAIKIIILLIMVINTFETDTAMVHMAERRPTVPSRVIQVVPLAELCNLICAT